MAEAQSTDSKRPEKVFEPEVTLTLTLEEARLLLQVLQSIDRVHAAMYNAGVGVSKTRPNATCIWFTDLYEDGSQDKDENNG